MPIAKTYKSKRRHVMEYDVGDIVKILELLNENETKQVGTIAFLFNSGLDHVFVRDLCKLLELHWHAKRSVILPKHVSGSGTVALTKPVLIPCLTKSGKELLRFVKQWEDLKSKIDEFREQLKKAIYSIGCDDV